ncbi:hypothetical protein [Streptomyces sp. NPDC056549]|uniref:hypothetical protein n=1 Tax=Streptomyces sp. NPDC056549 TaxID=3345864 RepID=UPI0036809B88
MARGLHERIEWERVREAVAGAPMGEAFLYRLELLGRPALMARLLRTPESAAPGVSGTASVRRRETQIRWPENPAQAWSSP